MLLSAAAICGNICSNGSQVWQPQIGLICPLIAHQETRRKLLCGMNGETEALSPYLAPGFAEFVWGPSLRNTGHVLLTRECGLCCWDLKIFLWPLQTSLVFPWNLGLRYWPPRNQWEKSGSECSGKPCGKFDADCISFIGWTEQPLSVPISS